MSALSVTSDAELLREWTSRCCEASFQTLVVKYKDGEKKVLVPPQTPIVSYAKGDRAEIKPGAQVIVMAATKKPDGSLEANRINVGRGVTPPM